MAGRVGSSDRSEGCIAPRRGEVIAYEFTWVLGLNVERVGPIGWVLPESSVGICL